MGGVISTGIRAGLDTVTGGLAEIGGGSKMAGNAVAGGLTNLLGGGQLTAPQVGGQQTPLQTLESSGGAPLLANIALGVDPTTAMAGYFGVDPSQFSTWLSQQSPSDQAAINGLTQNLTQISQSTTAKQQAVTDLVNNYPNMMAQMIPQFKATVDASTMAAANQALANVASKYAAGGGLSSGAAAAAIARTAATTDQGNYALAANEAQTGFNQQLNNANALLSFQQKMLGQGAQNGFNAVQNTLNRNANINAQNANLQNQANQFNTNATNNMWSNVGKLGAVAGLAAFGGPAGAVAASAANATNSGSGATPNYSQAPTTSDANLNLPGMPTNPTTGYNF